MASNIDPTQPTAGQATTQSVRDNFQASKDEIEALQAKDASQDANISTLENTKVAKTGDTMTGPLTVEAGARVDTLVFTRNLFLPNNTDLNTVTDAGFYDVNEPVNGPEVIWGYLNVYRHRSADTHVYQEFIQLGGGNHRNRWCRRRAGGIWSVWSRMAFMEDINPLLDTIQELNDRVTALEQAP